MFRLISTQLDAWLADPGRQPLILRGMRQAGKTWLARDLARRSGRDLVELNFEAEPDLARYFSSNDPRTILSELSLVLGRDLEPDRCLLFLDEIQAAGELLAKLRWFYERLPELPVLAAGSLLEFALAKHAISIPVGRMAFRHVEPLGFREYLLAHGQDRLLAALAPWRPGACLSQAAHDQATAWWGRFAMVGGIPAVLAADVAGREPKQLREMQMQNLATYRADFAKYQGRMDPTILDKVLLAAVGSLGRKFMYAHVGEGVKQQQAKHALELLSRAKVLHLVHGTSGDGLPLGAGLKPGFQKAILGDVGLAHALLRTPAGAAFPKWEQVSPALRGPLTEQLAGQELRLLEPSVGDGPRLYYWQREGGRPAELDYLIQVGTRILPVELKSGAAGAMKSLHQFMFDRKLDLALRCDANPPSFQNLKVKTTQGQAVEYRLINLPLYLLWNLEAILPD